MAAKNLSRSLQRVFDEGLYDPSNEPDIAYPYLFSHIKGEEWRTQREVSRLLDKYFTTRPDGIPGNDDAGTMSAWAVFSMMGLYPDIPGVPEYTLTTPTFDKITISLDRRYYPTDSIVIYKDSIDCKPGITLGGKPCGHRISHRELIDGQELNINISSKL